MATFLVIGFALITTVAIVSLLDLAISTVDFGTVYFERAISQAALCCALTLTSHVPPASNGTINPCQYF